ncbi:MAG: hypothetical protein ACREGJ_00240 [Candidatus Saccharimonadales bacterium]
MAHPERITGSERGTEALERAAGERTAELKERLEAQEGQPEKLEDLAQRARVEAAKEARSGKERGAGEQEQTPVESAPPTASKSQRKTAYKQTMRRVQEELSPSARTFSKFIHAPLVERVSDVAGSTVARPNAILSGSISAFIIVTALYLLARHLGFALSGFETIAAFVAGWVLGVAIDLLRVMVRGKR